MTAPRQVDDNTHSRLPDFAFLVEASWMENGIAESAIGSWAWNPVDNGDNIGCDTVRAEQIPSVARVTNYGRYPQYKSIIIHKTATARTTIATHCAASFIGCSFQSGAAGRHRGDGGYADRLVARSEWRGQGALRGGRFS